MTKIPNNSLLKGATGTFGDHYFKNMGGQTYLVKRPTTRGPKSDKQQAVANRFKQAALYAKEQLLDPTMKALYETGITRKKSTAYLVAVSDFLNAPEIEKIDTRDYYGNAGEAISIVATDDFKVIAVKVEIKMADGTVLESDDAVHSLMREDEWKYITTAANSSPCCVISVTAFDFAGNKTTIEKIL